jgi:hypothetical protein
MGGSPRQTAPPAELRPLQDQRSQALSEVCATVGTSLCRQQAVNVLGHLLTPSGALKGCAAILISVGLCLINLRSVLFTWRMHVLLQNGFSV